MTLTPEIIWVALAALIIGFILGYGVRSFVSLLRRRRRRRSRSSGHGRRMELQSDNDWRAELENDLSQVTTAAPSEP
jgi:hypothetical protein